MYSQVAERLPVGHTHVFLGTAHEANERKTWAVIALCSAMMLIEIIGGTVFGSLALVADGLHMATHAVAILIAALAYQYARRHIADRRFTFGTGKVGDLAGFSSALVLAMIALLVGYEAVARLFQPVVIHFSEAIPIAVLGLAVNLLSAWLLSGSGGHGHSHEHSHGHSHGHMYGADGLSNIEHSHLGGESVRLKGQYGGATLEINETEGAPRFRMWFAQRALGQELMPVTVETVRLDGSRMLFSLVPRGEYLESIDEIPEPHTFRAAVRLGGHPSAYQEEVEFQETHHGTSAATHRDHNLRAAFVHVVGDAAVSVLAILGLFAAKLLGWVWMDPIMGFVGAGVIALWAYSLIRDTSKVLVDVTPDAALEDQIRRRIEVDGDMVSDLHLWRLGPGHLGAIIAVSTARNRDADFYKSRLQAFGSLSHVTVEVVSSG